jgi:hypothetical protein
MLADEFRNAAGSLPQDAWRIAGQHSPLTKLNYQFGATFIVLYAGQKFGAEP